MDNDQIVEIPIFVITCDRLEMLKKSMESYSDHIKAPFKIVICDQGTTFKPTVNFLKRMGSNGTKVYWRGNVNKGRERNLARDNAGINEYIQDYFKTHPKSNYVVTDPDIFLDDVNGDILEAYTYLLGVMPEIAVVGPMLRIDDIPERYPLRRRLLKNSRHRSFHLREKHIINYNGGKIKYIHAKIDTTFGMYRAGTQWRRLQIGIRTFAPYSAKHLDWYVDPQNMTEDQKYYMGRASRNAHWSKWS